MSRRRANNRASCGKPPDRTAMTTIHITMTANGVTGCYGRDGARRGGALHSEISLSHPIVGQKSLSDARERDAAVFQHIGAARELERGGDVLFHQHAGQALSVELANG